MLKGYTGMIKLVEKEHCSAVQLVWSVVQKKQYQCALMRKDLNIQLLIEIGAWNAENV